MAALTAVQHVAVHLFVVWIQFAQAPEDSVSVEAKPGETVTLQCHSPTHAAITVLEWKGPEMKEHYVFYFRDNEANEKYRDPRYRGRVELRDPKMKNGDASVLLKNVTKEDTGMYQCRVTTPSNDRRKRDVGELVCSVQLIVSEGPEEHLKNGDANGEQPGGPRGNVGLGVVFSSLVLYL